jgi:plasmid replication initiation protein
MLGGLRPGFEGSQDYDLLLRAADTPKNRTHSFDTLSLREVPGQRSKADESIEHGRWRSKSPYGDRELMGQGSSGGICETQS